MLLNNWPVDVIQDGFCKKCFHLCTTCGKYVRDGDEVYDSVRSKKRYCTNCYQIKHYPEDGNFKYKMGTVKDKGKICFARWRKTHKNIECIDCSKNFWQPINKKSDKCMKCSKTKKPKEPKPSNNPSTKNKYYEKVEEEWQQLREQVLCQNCLTSLWIDKDNIFDGPYNCVKCRPDETDTKFKYNKEKQRWIAYRKKINCTSCHKEKWLFVKDGNQCKKCNKS
jgi:hypothetical protein